MNRACVRVIRLVNSVAGAATRLRAADLAFFNNLLLLLRLSPLIHVCVPILRLDTRWCLGMILLLLQEAQVERTLGGSSLVA